MRQNDVVDSRLSLKESFLEGHVFQFWLNGSTGYSQTLFFIDDDKNGPTLNRSPFVKIKVNNSTLLGGWILMKDFMDVRYYLRLSRLRLHLNVFQYEKHLYH